ncbi:MAG: MFS transporter [Eubacteriales bacterium]|nr:MFS transporter [Bacillota bacterium]MBU4597882.1 MFS transporter [Pseudomonadota bacterium]MBV1728326.1 MFS transporter [Desulforudis sp.]MDQ7789624.1 MFS transporter [Clostridia bacterium]MDZ4042685.1 MFS transporter [Eubacteriales bacterium]
MSKEGSTYQPAVLMAVVLFLALLPSFSLPAVLPLVEQDWGMRPSQSGTVMAFFQVGYILTAIIALPLTDRLDARRIVMCGALLTVASHILFALVAKDPMSASVLRGLAGAGIGCIYMPGLRIVSRVDNLRGRAVGFYVSFYLFGTAFSFLATGVLVSYYTWQQSYLTVALFSALSVPVALYLIMRIDDTTMLPRRQKQTSETGPRPGWRVRYRQNLPVILMISVYVVHMWEFYGMRSWISPYLAHVLGEGSGAATSLAATITSFLIMLSASATFLAGSISDRYGRLLTASMIMLTSVVCSFAFGWLIGSPLWLIIIVGAIYSIMVVADTPIVSTGITELSDPERLGRIMAWQTFLGYTAASIAPITFGLILEHAQPNLAWGFAFSSLGLVAIFGPLLLMLLARLPEKASLCNGRG